MGLVSLLTLMFGFAYAFQGIVVFALLMIDLDEPRSRWAFKSPESVLVNLIPGMLPYLVIRNHFREPQ